MTEGSIAKNIILFYIPLAIGGLFQQLYSFVDSVVVGRGIGAQALAAVGATSIVVWLTLGFAMGITKGFCIHISQAYGKKDYHLVNRGFFVASVLSLIVGTMISIVGSLAIRDFLILMHTPGEILEQSLDYIKVILLGFVITVLNNLFMSVLQSLGDSSTPFCALLVSSITNVGLDCVFVLILKWGVQGAAVATVLSRYTETAIVVIWAHTHEKENTYMTGLYKTLSVPRDHVKKYFIKGTPLLLNEALWSFGMAVLAQNYSVRGLTVIAAMNIANTINNLFSVVFAAMGESVAIIVGQALGFGDMKRAREIDNKMIVSCVLISFAVSVFMFLFAPFFPRIYNTTEAVRKAAMGLVLAQAVFIPQNAFLNAAYFTLRAGGKTGVTFFFDCVFLWCVNIPIVFVLCRYTGLAPWAVYSAMQIGEWLKCIAGAVMVKKGVWLENLTGKGEDEKYLLRENEEKH